MDKYKDYWTEQTFVYSHTEPQKSDWGNRIRRGSRKFSTVFTHIWKLGGWIIWLGVGGIGFCKISIFFYPRTLHPHPMSSKFSQIRNIVSSTMPITFGYRTANLYLRYHSMETVQRWISCLAQLNGIVVQSSKIRLKILKLFFYVTASLHLLYHCTTVRLIKPYRNPVYTCTGLR